ncbi:MAG: hypothetical protein Q9162_005844 [Coniocarpon cinnabarinum]
MANGRSRNTPSWFRQPVFYQAEDKVVISYSPTVSTIPSDKQPSHNRKSALEALEASANKHAAWIKLEAGDILLANNLALLHSRSQFHDGESDLGLVGHQQRHLLRMWLKQTHSCPELPPELKKRFEHTFPEKDTGEDMPFRLNSFEESHKGTSDELFLKNDMRTVDSASASSEGNRTASSSSAAKASGAQGVDAPEDDAEDSDAESQHASDDENSDNDEKKSQRSEDEQEDEGDNSEPQGSDEENRESDSSSEGEESSEDETGGPTSQQRGTDMLIIGGTGGDGSGRRPKAK